MGKGDPEKAAKLLGITVNDVNEITNVLTKPKALQKLGITQDEFLAQKEAELRLRELKKVMKKAGFI